MRTSAAYQAVNVEESDVLSTETSQRQGRSNRIVASILLGLCIVSFVLQTELAQYVQQSTHYQKPYFILYLSHSMYAFLIPFQFLVECIIRTRSASFRQPWKHVKKTWVACKADLTTALQDLQARPQPLSVMATVVALALLFTIPAYLWYVSVGLTSAANLTAIYNTGCFFAYLFSILMLGDRLVAGKLGAVVLCIAGVFVLAYGVGQDKNSDTPVADLAGIIVAIIGAMTYGFYEVYYKKYASPTEPTVLFANVVTGLIGVVTILVLWIPIPILHWSGLETFEVPDAPTLQFILAIGSMSLVYNACFMGVIALVSPVFAAVGVMLTVPAVTLTDMIVSRTLPPWSTLIGSLFVLVGFGILQHEMQDEVKKPK